MGEKVRNIPLPVIIIGLVAALALAGFFINRTIQANDTAPPAGNYDQKRYMEEMNKRMKSNSYSSQGQPGSTQPGMGGPGGMRGPGGMGGPGGRPGMGGMGGYGGGGMGPGGMGGR